MIFKQLYRYLFCDWHALSTEEKEQAPTRLKQFTASPVFQEAVQKLQAHNLYTALFGDQKSTGYYYAANDEDIIKWFSSFNQKHHYFTEIMSHATQFFTLYRLFNVFDDSMNNDASFLGLLSHNIIEFCYKIMVLFESDTIEKTLDQFENYCQVNQYAFDKKLFEHVSALRLSHSKGNQAIDLPALRTLFFDKKLTDCEKLLQMAIEIENQLGRAPKTFDEAMNAAKSRRFQQSEQCPDYARFCSEQLIPESLFNDSISENPAVAVDATIALIHQLEPAALNEFISLIPVRNYGYYQLGQLLKALPVNQEKLIALFAAPVKNAVKTIDEFTSILSRLSTRAAQQALADCLGEKAVQGLLNEISQYEIQYLLKTIHVDYREDFLWNVVGKERINMLTTSSYELRSFIGVAMPGHHQVGFLKDLFGIEKLRALITSHYDVVDHLKLLNNDEKVTYLNEVVGQQRLIEVLDSNWCMLESVLRCLPQSQCVSVLFDLIGVETLRKTIRLHGDLRAQEAMLRLLPENQKALFLEQLLPDKEKKARSQLQQTKARISNHVFSLGILGCGYGGEEITLDDGSKKKVPKTVKAQWELIKDGERQHRSYADAWQEVQKLGKEVKLSSWTPQYFVRATDTTDYYKSFSESPQPGGGSDYC